ncbi:MAG: DNA methyltransferase [Methanotrichaceae archaeon]|jgi:hypothetical protein
MKLSLESIELDSDLQPRVVLDQGTVIRYVEALKRGDSFPAVVVFYDGVTYWLADGFHRVTAAKLAGLTEIEADIRNGSKKNALLHSVSANEEHGLPRTQADKKKAITSLLDDPEFKELSDRDIGRFCRVDHKTVSKYRREFVNPGSEPKLTDPSGEFPTEIQLVPSQLQWSNVWEFPELTKDHITYPGHLPEVLLENVLYYWSEPGQMVYDPFAYTGSMGFVAERMGRRFEMSDIAPLDRRIRQHDILTCIPDGLIKPDLIFLDPPVMELEKFEKIFSSFSGFKGTKVAIITGPPCSKCDQHGCSEPSCSYWEDKHEIWKITQRLGWKQIDDSRVIFDPLITPEEEEAAIRERRQFSSYLSLDVFEVA